MSEKLEITGGEAIARMFAAHDVGLMFGMGGFQLLPFYDAVPVSYTHLDVYKRQVWDHAFLVFEGDTAVRGFLDSMPGHKTVVLDRIPTAENLAAIIFEILAPHYHGHYGADLRLTRVRLYETPNCWADCNG